MTEHVEKYTEVMARNPELALDARVAQMSEANQRARSLEEELKRLCGPDEELATAPRVYLAWQLALFLSLLVTLHRSPFDLETARKLASRIQSCEGRVIQHLLKGAVGDRERAQVGRHLSSLFFRYACALQSRGAFSLPRSSIRIQTGDPKMFNLPSTEATIATLLAASLERRAALAEICGLAFTPELLKKDQSTRERIARQVFNQAVVDANADVRNGDVGLVGGEVFTTFVSQKRAIIDAYREGLREPGDGELELARAAALVRAGIINQRELTKRVFSAEIEPEPLVPAKLTVVDLFLNYLSCRCPAAWSMAERRLIRKMATHLTKFSHKHQKVIAELDAQLRQTKTPRVLTEVCLNNPRTDREIGGLINGVTHPVITPALIALQRRGGRIDESIVTIGEKPVEDFKVGPVEPDLVPGVTPYWLPVRRHFSRRRHHKH